MITRNYFADLGIAPTMTLGIIRDAYKAKALETHPDRAKSEADRVKMTELFKPVSAAWEVLEDAEKRRLCYDKFAKFEDIKNYVQSSSQQKAPDEGIVITNFDLKSIDLKNINKDPQANQIFKQFSEANRELDTGFFLPFLEIAAKDYKILKPMVDWLAENGHVESQFKLARIYRQDDAACIRWTREAAKNRHPHAMLNLGIYYTEGRKQGINIDLDIAKIYFREVLESSHAEAVRNAEEYLKVHPEVDLRANRLADKNKNGKQFAIESAEMSRSLVIPEDETHRDIREFLFDKAYWRAPTYSLLKSFPDGVSAMQKLLVSPVWSLIDFKHIAEAELTQTSSTFVNFFKGKLGESTTQFYQAIRNVNSFDELSQWISEHRRLSLEKSRNNPSG